VNDNSKQKWQNLADFFNVAEIAPSGGHDPSLPNSLYNEAGTWGISYKFNGGNARWFVVAGPNLGTIEHYNRSTGVSNP